jgi:hypothetical protein
VESPAQSFIELLGAADYEKHSTAKPRAVKVAKPKPIPMAEASWADAMSTADRLKQISDLALTMELNRRGYRAAGKVLSGKYHDSGKRKHLRRKNKSQGEN